MNTLGIYIYNSDRDQWLDDNNDWGDFSDAKEFTADEAEVAEAIRVGLGGPDTTFVMAALH